MSGTGSPGPELLAELARTRPGPGGVNLVRVARLLQVAFGVRAVTLQPAGGQMFRWPEEPAPGPAGPSGRSSGRSSGQPARAERRIPLLVAGEHVGELVLENGARRLAAHREALLAEVVDLLGPVMHLTMLQRELDASLDSARGHAERVAAVRRRAFAERDAERGDLERDLHDGAQHHLVALGMRIGLLEVHAATRDDAALQEQLILLKQGVARAESTLLSTASGVSPAVLEEFGLYRALMAEFGEAGEQVRVVVSEGDQARRYGTAVEIAVYFICLEAGSNARKHASGVRITVTLDEGPTGLAFAVSDQGAGLHGLDVEDSFGLENMRRRIIAAGGRLQVRTSVGAGTTIAGFIPF